jgi:hypothetical protein
MTGRVWDRSRGVLSVAKTQNRSLPGCLEAPGGTPSAGASWSPCSKTPAPCLPSLPPLAAQSRLGSGRRGPGGRCRPPRLQSQPLLGSLPPAPVRSRLSPPWMDGWMSRWMDRWTDGWTDGWTLRIVAALLHSYCTAGILLQSRILFNILGCTGMCALLRTLHIDSLADPREDNLGSETWMATGSPFQKRQIWVGAVLGCSCSARASCGIPAPPMRLSAASSETPVKVKRQSSGRASPPPAASTPSAAVARPARTGCRLV